ncbi:MAG: 5'-nucleotidase [Archangiaceae bacterium]|nr:5'-nucleotidase [Archangiaceae bacterium]
MNPLGGLPRRKKLLEKEKGALVLDAGNALFRAPGLDDDASKKRAKFVLDTMATLGTQAMAVGDRDLVAGLPWLLEAARGSKLKLLSANLRGADQQAPFEGSTVLKAGALKVGVIGASPAKTGIPPLVGVLEEVKKLKGKVDLTVVLAAMPYADALQISTELKGQIDFVIQSGDSRATNAQLAEGNVTVGAGERGRTLGKLSLTLAGKGGWVNADQATTDQASLANLDLRITELKNRRKGITDKKALADFDATLAQFSQRRAELARAASAATAPGARSYKLEWLSLDTSVGDDEALKARVLEFEPTYAAPH